MITHWYRNLQARSRLPQPLPEPDSRHGTYNFELMVKRAAIFADIVGCLGYGIATTGDLFTLAVAIASIGGSASSTMQAALTKHVPKENIG